MKVEVSFFGPLAKIVGFKRVKIIVSDDTNVKMLLNELRRKWKKLDEYFGDQGKIRANLLLIVNGKEINVLQGLDTKLKQGDEVTLIPVVHGG